MGTNGSFRQLTGLRRTMLPGLKSGVTPSTSFPGNRFWDIMSGGLFPAYFADQLLRHDEGVCECGDHKALADGACRDPANI